MPGAPKSSGDWLTVLREPQNFPQDLSDSMTAHLRLHFSNEEASDEQVCLAHHNPQRSCLCSALPFGFPKFHTTNMRGGYMAAVVGTEEGKNVVGPLVF